VAVSRMLILPDTAFAAIATILLLALCGCEHSRGTSGQAPKLETVVIGGEKFDLELALDDAARERGMMGRNQIPDHGGMLFVFPDSKVRVQSFWMGHCLVDIDIIFLDRRGFVTATHRMKAEPPRRADESEADYDARMPRYSSGYPAQFVIELKAGTLDRLNIRFEQRIDLDIPRLKAMAR
jgi:uncharacterized membrane protein (UPF0127 family)